MKYIPLSSLQNTYSSITKYRPEPNGVSIDGFYKENSLNIPTLDFDTLGVIPGTSFRFIVRVFDSEGSQNALNTFTSDGYYSDLLRARNSGNPYFINTALNPNTFVKIYLGNLQSLFFERTSKESPQGVSCQFNNLFDGNGSVNYTRFGQYIDWVVSKPNLNEVVDNGVLKSSEISRFEINAPIPQLADFLNTTTSTTGGRTNLGGGGDDGDDEENTGGGAGQGGNTGGGTDNGGGDPLPGSDPIVRGCTDPRAINYNPNANQDDGSCSYPASVFGCTNPEAINYNPLATIDDGSCLLRSAGTGGSSSPGGEGEQGNPPLGGNNGNRTGNPNDDIANEYEYRYRKTDREL